MFVTTEPSTSANVVVAVCMGRNPLKIHQNATAMFEYLDKYTNVLILICDDIHRFEQSISRHISDSKALRRAIKEGDEIEAVLKEAIGGHEKNTTIVRWKDIQDETFSKQLSALYRHLSDLKDDLNQSSRYYIQNRVHPGLEITQEHLDKFNDYTLHELPVQLGGARFAGVEYTEILHPVFVSNIAQAQQYRSPIAGIKQTVLLNDDIMQDFGPVPQVHLHRLYFPVS